MPIFSASGRGFLFAQNHALDYLSPGRSENRGFADSALRRVAALRTLLPVLAGDPPPDAAQHPSDELDQLPEQLQQPSDPSPYPLDAVPELVSALLVVLCHVLAFLEMETVPLGIF